MVDELPDGREMNYTGVMVTPVTQLMAALVSGFIKTNKTTQSEVKYNCPTGYCTWPLYILLAVCSSCNDVKDHLEYRASAFGPHTSMANSLPSISVHINEDREKNGRTRIKFPNLVAQTLVNRGQTISFQHLDALVVAVGIIQLDKDFEVKSSVEDVSISATECSFYLCVNAYRPYVWDGVLKEDIRSLKSQRVADSYALMYSINQSTFHDVEILNNHSLVIGQSWQFNRTDLQLQISQDEWLPHDAAARVFNITHASAWSAVQAVDRYLFHHFIRWPTINETYSPFQFMVAGELHRSRSEDLLILIRNVAQSLTTFIRATSSTPEGGGRREWVTSIKGDMESEAREDMAVKLEESESGLGLKAYNSAKYE